MNNAGAGFGLFCEDCNITIDIVAKVGGDPGYAPNVVKKWSQTHLLRFRPTSHATNATHLLG